MVQYSKILRLVKRKKGERKGTTAIVGAKAREVPLHLCLIYIYISLIRPMLSKGSMVGTVQ